MALAITILVVPGLNVDVLDVLDIDDALAATDLVRVATDSSSLVIITARAGADGCHGRQGVAW